MTVFFNELTNRLARGETDMTLISGVGLTCDGRSSCYDMTIDKNKTRF